MPCFRLPAMRHHLPGPRQRPSVHLHPWRQDDALTIRALQLLNDRWCGQRSNLLRLPNVRLRYDIYASSFASTSASTTTSIAAVQTVDTTVIPSRRWNPAQAARAGGIKSLFPLFPHARRSTGNALRTLPPAFAANQIFSCRRSQPAATVGPFDLSLQSES